MEGVPGVGVPVPRPAPQTLAFEDRPGSGFNVPTEHEASHVRVRVSVLFFFTSWGRKWQGLVCYSVSPAGVCYVITPQVREGGSRWASSLRRGKRPASGTDVWFE